jgi:hypothetical protein
MRRESWLPAALICTVLANIHRGEESEPYTIEDFIPGARPPRDSEEEEMRQFIDEIQSGKKFETPPEELERFKRSLEANFRNVVPCSTLTDPK